MYINKRCIPNANFPLDLKPNFSLGKKIVN
jgi:hypothetical protein